MAGFVGPNLNVISWVPNEPITDDKLNAMVANDEKLRDSMMCGSYNGYYRNVQSGLRHASGIAGVGPSKDATADIPVYFDGFFSDGCYPLITTGVLSWNHRMIFVTVDGLGGNWTPDNIGFEVHAKIHAYAKKNRYIKDLFFVSWHAVGW